MLLSAIMKNDTGQCKLFQRCFYLILFSSLRISKNAVKCSQPLFNNLHQLRGRWPTHTQNLRTFFAFCAKKKGVLKRVLREFLLLLFNAVSLFCSALFRKTMVFCLKMLPAKHQINMCISQYQKGGRAAVRKGCAQLREQGVLKAAVPSMRLSEKTVEWEVAKPQIKIGKFSSNSSICYFYLKLIASIGKTLSLKCFQISLANIKSVRHNQLFLQTLV